MRIPRVYLDLNLELHADCELPLSQSHYLLKVLRLQPGRTLTVFNGRGGEFKAVLTAIHNKTASIHIESFSKSHCESPLNCELAIGVSKGDRMDWIMQKTTELGVSAIRPLLCERSEVKLSSERWQKKLNHWREIIISACEQCGRTTLPLLSSPRLLHHFFEDSTTATCKLILHPHKSDTDIKLLDQAGQVSLMVGPEGGFSAHEVQAAKQHGYLPWCLGPRVLRTETAPVVALSVIQHLWGDLQK